MTRTPGAPASGATPQRPGGVPPPRAGSARRRPRSGRPSTAATHGAGPPAPNPTCRASEVEEQDAWRLTALIQQAQGLPALGRDTNCIPLAGERIGIDIPEVGIVLDDQDTGRRLCGHPLRHPRGANGPRQGSRSCLPHRPPHEHVACPMVTTTRRSAVNRADAPLLVHSSWTGALRIVGEIRPPTARNHRMQQAVARLDRVDRIVVVGTRPAHRELPSAWG